MAVIVWRWNQTVCCSYPATEMTGQGGWSCVDQLAGFFLYLAAILIANNVDWFDNNGVSLWVERQMFN